MRYFLFFFLIIATASCKQILVNEKLVDLPAHEWKKTQNVVLNYNIQDSVNHQLNLIVRHTQQFLYNKLIVNLIIQDSLKDTITSMNINAPLTNASGNWNGEQMDGIYYNRIKIQPQVFLKPGHYRFVLQHQMKENLLPYILNVGIAIDN